MIFKERKYMKIPYISGEWKPLFRPEKFGNYINDHSLIKDNKGNWHLFGITSFDAKPSCERYFAHGIGSSLECEFGEAKPVIDRGTLAWAPGTIEKDGYFYMFYGPSPTSLAVSPDMYEWFGTNVTLKNEPLMGAHRDHFVLKLDDGSYLMYVVGIKDRRSAVSCFSSSDLLTWNFEGFALTSGENAPLNPAWGAMESPFVVKMDGEYYLFVTYTNCARDNYCNTMVFCSKDPKNFGVFDGDEGDRPITVLNTHAPEIVEENGKYYITTCGWRGYPNPYEGSVSIAPLDWKEL